MSSRMGGGFPLPAQTPLEPGDPLKTMPRNRSWQACINAYALCISGTALIASTSLPSAFLSREHYLVLALHRTQIASCTAARVTRGYSLCLPFSSGPAVEKREPGTSRNATWCCVPVKEKKRIKREGGGRGEERKEKKEKRKKNKKKKSRV